jgi:hypothetical protein
MPTRHPPHRAAIVLAVALLAALVLEPATASAFTPPAVSRIDGQMAHAREELLRWQAHLKHWQIRVGRVEARVQWLTYMASDVPTFFPDVLDRRTSRHLVIGDQVVLAHVRLQRILRDHAAQEALQQSAAWSAYLSRLVTARAEAIVAWREHRAAVAPGGPVTFEAWAGAFLATIGASPCANDLLVVVTWETAESTQALNNPLATTQMMPGATLFNGSGVKNYVSVSEGLDASRLTLDDPGGTLGYGAVVDALRSCAAPEVTAGAIRDSSWCSGCAGGAYVVSLLPEVRASWADHASRLIATG